MRIFSAVSALWIAVLVLFCGCSKHPAPPTARNDLLLRFFNSLETGNAKAAGAQAKKLLAMEPNNDFIGKIVEVQESNQGVIAAQKEINAGNIENALQIIDENIRQYPDNRTLPQLRAQLHQLRNARQLLLAMKRADSVEAMSSSLTAASTGLSANLTPQLAKYFADYDKRIAARRAAAAQAAVKAQAPGNPPAPPQK